MFDIQGTNNSERLVGAAASESIYTGDGADTVLAGAGNDSVNGAMVNGQVSYYPVTGAKLLSGEEGNDLLYGGSDADTIAGDAGNDTLYGGAGNDSLSGGLGDDQIKGGEGNDAIDAGDGADDIDTGNGVDSVLAGSGNDNINGYTVDAQAGTYSFNAYAGNKSVDAGAGDDFVFGGTGNDTLVGGDGLDSLYGHAGNDSLLGGAGADALQTGDGQDTVLGGDGNDNINGHIVNAQTGSFTFTSSSGPKLIDAGAGDDFAYGGSGADTIAGDVGNDTLHGDAGNDSLSGGVGNDQIKGGEGNDTIDAGEGADDIDTGNGVDSVLAGNGNDNINGFTVDAQADTYSFNAYAGNKSVDAGAGDDFVFGGTGNDSLVGGDGLDSLHGHTGNDTLQGDAGDDALFGDEGDDSLLGGAGADDIQTGDGQDTVLGGDGNDNINGHNVNAQEGTFTFTSYSGPKSIDAGAGDDFVYGGSGNDSILGGAGHDTLHGSTGADSLDGGLGNDSLSAGDGNDTLASLYGQDTLNGGAGDDRYLIGAKRFTLTDESGTDAALVSVDFVKIPSFIETVEYAQGTQALPYWVSALLPDEAAGFGFLSALGSSRTYSYTFPQAAPAYLEADSDYVKGWTAFTSAEIDAAKLSLNYIASLVDLKFVQSSVADATNTLSFANNTQTGSAGYALHPSDSALGSDVFLNDTTENREAKDGTYAALTLIHEIGHALGLKHPFSAPDSTGDSAPPPYLSTSEDVTAWTVMSYTSSPAEYAFEFSELDIAALQYLYGPSPTSRTTNDTYTVSNAATNFVWDGAGTDLLDASALSQPVSLYLTPGYWGFVGSARASTITAPGQVTVNFGSTIENLKGGSQADRLYGNASANQILGGAGDDVLQGWDGSDTLSGGLGNDTLYGGASADIGARNRGTDVAVFAGNRSSYQITWAAATDTVTVSSASEGTDTLWDIEQLQFADATLQVAALRDTLAPTLMAASPVNGALQVPYDAPIVLKFSEAVQAGTGSFTLKSGNASVVSVDITDSRYVQIQGSTVTIALPANVIAPDTTYTAVTTLGAIRDLVGNNWASTSSTYSFTFTNASVATADIIPPLIDSTTWRGVVSPSAPIRIPFSETIVRGTGDIWMLEYNPVTFQALAEVLIAVNVADKVLTLVPSQTLSNTKSYAIGFSAGAIKDLAGNDFNFPAESTAAKEVVYKFIHARPLSPKFVTTSSVISSVDPQVTFSTTLGPITMELDADLAPISTANMLAYVNSGLYDGTLFHRVIPGLIVQGGGLTAGMIPLNSTFTPILNEANNGLKNLSGTVAMARTTDFNSATSQFFINDADNAQWNGSYAVFGKVLSGMSLVDQMTQKPTRSIYLTSQSKDPMYENVPVTDVTTITATQTQLGQWFSTTGLLSVSDVTNNATWQYSLNSGTSWQLGSGNYLRVPDGFYAAGTLQVRQTDAQGLVSSAYAFPGSLQVNKTSAFQLTGTSVFWKGMSTSPKALAGVQMSSELADKTDALGVVDLSGVESMSSAASGTVVLSPTLSSPTNAKSAISLTDVLAALKIYLGKSVPDSYASPLNYVAADFDASGSVTLTDVLQMLKYYLGKATINNVKPEWAFIDAADLGGTGSSATALAANGQALSKTNALPHAVDVDLMSGADTLQLVGVLRGDVDGSWTDPPIEVHGL